MNGSVSLACQLIELIYGPFKPLPKCGVLRKCRLARGESYVSLRFIGLESEKYIAGLLVRHPAKGNKQDKYDVLNFVIRDNDAAYKGRMFFHQV
jgi:hypothetical protein